MTLRHLILLAAAGAGLSAPLAAQAMPLHLNTQSGTAQILLVDDDGDDDESWSKGGDDDEGGGKAAMNCGEGEDDDEGGCANGQALQPQNANPPANGLITPGSKPQVQIN